jgi:meiotic recombination protein REC8, fungi type
VYDQQCGYVLSDAQHAQNSMRALFRVVRAAELDPEAAKVRYARLLRHLQRVLRLLMTHRPDQIILQDDPAFLPDFDFSSLNIDLPDFRATAPEDTQLSNFSIPGSRGGSQQGGQPQQQATGLTLPPSKSSAVPGFGFVSDSAATSRGVAGEMFAQDDELLPDVGFEIDEMGNVVETGAGMGGDVVTPGADKLALRAGLSSEARQRVEREHAEGQQRGVALQVRVELASNP